MATGADEVRVAIYHFSAQVLGRGPGRRNADGSARRTVDNTVKAAAYRAGAKLRDERENRTQDYSRRAGVAQAEIMLPEGAAPWLADRERLWNEVERLEARRDAQLAREINIALPHEISHAERVELVRGFVAEQFVSEGMVADIAWHNPVPEKGDDPRNFHAHVMLTLRKATRAGLHGVKTREWNSRERLGGWRAAWQAHANRALERAGKRDRIDHRTLVEQRAAARERGDWGAAVVLDRAPEIHVGPRPKAMRGREAEVTSKARRHGGPRPDRPPSQLVQDPPRRQSYEAFRRERAAQRDAERAMFAEERLRRAEERWARRRQWEERQREARFRRDRWERRQAEAAARGTASGARRGGGQGAYRVRNYPGSDQGPRIGWLWNILAGNNQRLKADLARIQAASARFDRWLDHWDRKATWDIDGAVHGAAFRRERWLKAQADREARANAERKAAHARKRADQMRALTAALRQALTMLGLRQEAGLRRLRQVEGWGRVQPRDIARALGAAPARDRGRPNGPSGRSS